MATEQEIMEFVGDVPPNYAAVVVKKDDGSLQKYCDFCHLGYVTGNGRMINSRCVGASSYSSNLQVFVVWRSVVNGQLKVAEYLGEFLFPEFQEMN